MKTNKSTLGAPTIIFVACAALAGAWATLDWNIFAPLATACVASGISLKLASFTRTQMDLHGRSGLEVTIPAFGMAWFPSLVVMLFGPYLMPADVTLWPAFASFVCAVWGAWFRTEPRAQSKLIQAEGIEG